MNILQRRLLISYVCNDIWWSWHFWVLFCYHYYSLHKMQLKLHTATLVVVYVEAVYTQKSTPSADNIRSLHTGKCLIFKNANCLNAVYNENEHFLAALQSQHFRRTPCDVYSGYSHWRDLEPRTWVQGYRYFYLYRGWYGQFMSNFC